MDTAKVSDFSDAADFISLELMDRREDRRHRIIDPDIQRPERSFHLFDGGVDGGRIGNIKGKDQSVPTESFHLAKS
jgi:hypothetical protein